MKRWMRALGLLALGAAGLFGCQDGGEEYLVSPFKATCEGVGPQTCLIGIREDTGEGTLFYEGIEGFTFRWGMLQTIRLSKVEVKDPPEDGSSVRYVLEELIESKPVPEEAIFTLMVNRNYLKGTRTSGYSLIDGTPMTCASSAVCDALEQKLGSETSPFQLYMDYPVVEGDPLIITGVP
ncbi:DUF4377 domain-containing protein [Hyalangium gracile]|uniref:DUF4377 domain-containing protein n=1 Tax=Hyalangium gracile TaxID=394092 RepID=UPI001CD00212|nr:DUF4377 domain-containing protein [Hyalangium gracile]